MKKRTDYRVCEDCGAALDPGERCDCKNNSLIEALLLEISRVQEIMEEYTKFPTGIFAVELMRLDVQGAKKALAESDLIGMVAAYHELQGYCL